MNSYENYFDTDIEWIGKIPSSWELARSGKFFTERSEKVDDVTYPPLSVTMNGIVDQLSGVAQSNDNDNRKLVKKDDFVINSRSDRKGSSGIAPRDGSVSLINIVLAPHDIDPKYIENLFKSYYFKEEYFRNGKGIHWDLWTTRWEQFKNINIPFPPIDEQKLISRYLDKKTEQIDRLVDKIQKKIELLKEQRTSLINQCVTKGLDPNVEMKDSGVEWIGETPKHWRRQRIKYFLSYTKGFAFKSEVFKDEGIPIVKASDIKKGTIKSPTVYLEPTDVGTYSKVILRTGDIVVSTVGSQYSVTDSAVGQLAIVPEELDGSLLNQNTVTVRLTDGHINRKFLFYTFLTQGFRSHLDVHSHGTANQASLNVEDILNYEMFFPDTSEQEKIVSSLDIDLRRLDQSQDLEWRRIRLLQEYRQSLISSVVTGKVRVTEDMV